MNFTNSRFRLGVLQCDEVRAELKSEHGDYDQMITNAITGADRNIYSRTYRIFEGSLPASAYDCDGWITTGSRHSVNDESDWTKDFLGFVESAFNSDRPFVGICYGMQMMAKALGGVVEMAPVGWSVGVKTSQLYVKEEWLDESLTKTVNLLVSHKEQVVRLPERARCIAGSDTCANAIIGLGSSMIGFQGHPEFSPDYARALMEVRRDVIPTKTIDSGLGSLDLVIDNKAIFSSIAQFLGASGFTSRAA